MSDGARAEVEQMQLSTNDVSNAGVVNKLTSRSILINYIKLHVKRLLLRQVTDHIKSKKAW